MRCYKCGRDLPPDSKFCQYCGEDLSKMRFCPFCGYQLRDGMNFCAQCGNDLRTAGSVQPNGTQGTVPLQEDAVPAWAQTAVVAPETVPEEQRETENLEDAQDSTPEGAIEDPEEANPEPAGEESAWESPLPDFGDGTEETGAADGLARNRKKLKWKLPALLCVIALIAGGVFLWRGGSGNQPKSVSEVANSVLYLEVFDKDDALIGTASGFLVGDQTTLVTNYHVAQDADHIEAWTADMAHSAYVGSILAYDEVADLAVLHCNSIVKAEPLTLGDSERVRQGDKVYAVGYPLGLANTLSDGIVSSRYFDLDNNDIIQVTAAISGGNSGGPLLDTNGRVIGVMCAYYVDGQNLNVAIASHTLEDLLASGFHKVSLTDWDDRPEMPGYESEEEEPEDAGEDVPDVVEEVPGESDADPETEPPEPEQSKPEPPKTGQGTETQESKPAAPAAPVTEDTGINKPPVDSGIVDPNAPSYGTSTNLPDTAVPLTAETVTGVWKANVYNDDDWDYEYFLLFSGNHFQMQHHTYIYEEYTAHDSHLKYVDDGTFYIDGPNIVVTYRTWSVWEGTISGWKTETWPVEYIHPGGIRFQNGVQGYVSYYNYGYPLPFEIVASG